MIFKVSKDYKNMVYNLDLLDFFLDIDLLELKV